MKTLTQYLIEVPQRIEPDEFNLNDVEHNRLLCKQLLKGYKLKLVNIDFENGSKLYNTKREIFLENNGLILYYVKYDINTYKLIKYPVISQSILWKTKGRGFNSDLIGLPTKVFFDILLPKTGVIATDKQQTILGERFWYERINQAFSKNYYIYYLNLLYPQELSQIKDYDNFESLMDNKEIWGNDNKHQSRKIIISKNKLD